LRETKENCTPLKANRSPVKEKNNGQHWRVRQTGGFRASPCKKKAKKLGKEQEKHCARGIRRPRG